MDGLKKNMHLVVFGAGVLLGIILLVTGIVMRGGSEGEIDTSINSVTSAQASATTKGDVENAKKQRGRFDAALTGAESALRDRGNALVKDIKPNTSPSAFFSDTVRPTLSDLKKRFDDMAGKAAGNEIGDMKAHTINRDLPSANEFWTQKETEMARPTAEQVRAFWMQLEIMKEFAATCEALLDSGAGDGMGVRLINFDFEPPAYVDNNASNAPWEGLLWTARIECSPGFAALLLDELMAPTERTSAKRSGFPNLFAAFQLELPERPATATYNIDADEKGTIEGITAETDPTSPAGQAAIAKRKEDLEKMNVTTPVTAAFRLRAAVFNPQWRAVRTEDDS